MEVCGKFSVSFCLSKISNLMERSFQTEVRESWGITFGGKEEGAFQQHATKVRGAAKPLPSQ